MCICLYLVRGHCVSQTTYLLLLAASGLLVDKGLAIPGHRAPAEILPLHETVWLACLIVQIISMQILQHGKRAYICLMLDRFASGGCMCTCVCVCVCECVCVCVHLRIHHHLRVLVSRGLYKAFTLLYFTCVCVCVCVCELRRHLFLINLMFKFASDTNLIYEQVCSLQEFDNIKEWWKKFIKS